LKAIGADVVGMSTVAETIATNHMGMEVLCISCVTNLAAGLSGEKLSHEEVLETANRISGTFLKLLRTLLPKLLNE
jgi:purine-nucleoside phosphorylase